MMWEKFTERARNMVRLAEEEAKAQGESHFVGTEHLLLGMLRERDNVGVRIIERLGVTPDRVVAAVGQEIARARAEQGGQPEPTPQNPDDAQELTSASRRVIDLAYDEARLLTNDYIGTEHLLLGMIREGNALAARVLAQLEITLERVREEVNNPLLNMDEAAKFLGISRPTLYRLLNQGELKGLKAGRQWRFNKWDLIAYTQRSPIAASAPATALDAELVYFGEELKRAGADLPEEDAEATDEGERKIALLIRRVVALAIHLRASDIHLEPIRQNSNKPELRLRLRMDGVLNEIRRMPMTLHESLFLYAKQWTGMDMGEKNLPQKGRVLYPFGDHEYELRLATLPSFYGETLVLRILERGHLLFSFDRLFLSEPDHLQIRQWMAQPNGLIITSGQSGSGKTTTLYSMLNQLDRPLAKLMTVEDSVEITLPDAIQTGVNKKAGLTYPVALRGIFNQDPDIVMIGDLPDRETAEIALEIAVTGHLVFIQMNNHTAAEAIHHLIELSDNALLVAQTLIGVTAQRLTRRLCKNCRQEVPVSSGQEPGMLDTCRQLARQGGYTMPEAFTLYGAVGCEECRQTGYRGRLALYEVMNITPMSGTPAISAAIIRNASVQELNSLAVSQGMRTLFADGMRKVVEGLTTLEEVIRVATTAP